ncbi:hypothetical protein OH76DRAFT_1413189 [Lentinus brumalis]|uniref:Uncharacterized protein n=1 Tax=Lentinus brumalis TaxID=2498619 RepID=A0A371CII7_9APHY|nr:hypothetical protein OH76DRAFT_1413189 [Polyporus brumalis]
MLAAHTGRVHAGGDRTAVSAGGEESDIDLEAFWLWDLGLCQSSECSHSISSRHVIALLSKCTRKCEDQVRTMRR